MPILGPLDALLLSGKKETKRGFLSELVLPLICGAAVAFLVSSLSIHLNRYVEYGILAFVSVFVYLIIVFIRLAIASRQQVYNIPGNIREEINNSKSFFCTSVIPQVLEDLSYFFLPDTIEILSFVAAKTAAQNAYKACRLLVFDNDRLLNIIQHNLCFDGFYARKIAVVHKSAKIDIAYMTLNKFIQLCGMIKTSDPVSLDMAMIGSSILIASKVKRESLLQPKLYLKYESHNAPMKPEYVQMVDRLLIDLYDTTSGDLKSEYDFYRLLFGHI
jgi:hypothetical protein